jgi:23S rRNA pseudouridine1911/1915/1917 synthase
VAGFGRQALHANRLGFRHPESGEPLEFSSALPNDMQRLIHSLELI